MKQVIPYTVEVAGDLIVKGSFVFSSCDWTKTLPTITGFYWIRQHVDHQPTIAKIIGGMVFFVANYTGTDLASYAGWQFKGPLTCD